MGKANCPFCNSQNTFNIAYGYLSEKKTKKNYINQEDIGLNESYRKGFEKYDFDGERLMRHLPNRYCKTCKNTFQSRKVMYTVDISIINFIICIDNNYYRYILDFSDKDNPKYSLRINWISIKKMDLLQSVTKIKFFLVLRVISLIYGMVIMAKTMIMMNTIGY